LRIAVAGIPGVGKTELAKKVSGLLGLPFVSVPVEEIFSGGDLRRKQYEAIYRQIEAENTNRKGFITDRPGVNYLAHWTLHFSLDDEESKRYAQLCLTRPYDLLAYIAPKDALDEEKDRLDMIIVGSLTYYKNRVVIYEDEVNIMAEEVLQVLKGGDLYWLNLGVS
jgi:MoxR-like ATPase